MPNAEQLNAIAKLVEDADDLMGEPVLNSQDIKLKLHRASKMIDGFREAYKPATHADLAEQIAHLDDGNNPVPGRTAAAAWLLDRGQAHVVLNRLKILLERESSPNPSVRGLVAEFGSMITVNVDLVKDESKPIAERIAAAHWLFWRGYGINFPASPAPPSLEDTEESTESLDRESILVALEQIEYLACSIAGEDPSRKNTARLEALAAQTERIRGGGR